MSLVNKVGTRNVHIFNKYDIEILDFDRMDKSHKELFLSCYHQGQCDDDCDQAKDYFSYDSEETYQAMINYIENSGCESCDLDDEDDVIKYFLWLTSGDYQENNEV